METRRTFLLGMLTLGLPVRAAARGFPGGLPDAFGSRFGARPDVRDLRLRRPRREAGALERVRHWNEVAIDTSGVDHTPVEGRVFGEQLGPGRASRAMAIVHTAIFDAMNAIAGGFQGYTGLRAAPPGTSVEAAIALAAHDTLVALFPALQDDLDEVLAADLGAIPEGRAKTLGIELGQAAAAAMLAHRENDGSDHPEPRIGIDWIPGNGPGQWRQDPISKHPLALGAHWGEVEPFVLQSSDQFRVPPPPAPSSRQYAAAYDEVKALGGDGIVTPTSRTDDQTFTGIFWAYDGTPSLCAPPRLYNQIAVHIAEQQRTDPFELARLLALINVAMADAGIAIWESKYHYRLWRPVTGIREDDGNSATAPDPTFSPLGAPASNLTGPNFTPPFPAYPSGHAGFGGALFQMLRNVYGTDRIAFTFVSDEFNGETLDNEGQPRPLVPRRFSSLSQAEEENGQSRIYLGIHWAYDKTQGIALGQRVADLVFRRAFARLR
jgi:PAP2 superfamily